MTFLQALDAAFRDDKRITRRDWAQHGPGLYGEVQGGMLMVRHTDHQWHQWIITESDFWPEDWEIVTDA